MTQRRHGDLRPNHHPSGNRGNHVITGFNSVVDEAALAVVAATCTSVDRNRVVEQTAGNTPGLKYWNGSAFVPLSPEIAQAGLDALEADQYPGAGRSTLYGAGLASLTSGGGSATISGPDAGWMRFLTNVVAVVVDGGSAQAASITLTHQPSDLVYARALAVTAANSIQLFGSNAMPLAAGESIAVVNDGASGSASNLLYSYVDVPAAGFSAVAVSVNSATKVPIIPAAASGFAHRIVFVGNATGYSSFGGPKGASWIYNDVPGSVTIESFEGSSLLWRRAATAAANNTTGLGVFGDRHFAAAALTAALRATASSRSVNIFLCYETLPLPA